jgi:acyl-CoA hydrolase
VTQARFIFVAIDESRQPRACRRFPWERTRMAEELVIRVTAMPTDLNPYGGVFGGWLMSQLALGAGSLASRRGKGKAVVVAATDLPFRA